MTSAEEGLLQFLERQFAAEDAEANRTEDAGHSHSDTAGWEPTRTRSGHRLVRPRSNLGPIFGVSQGDLDRAAARLAGIPTLSSSGLVVKRAIDILFSSLFLLFLLPLFLLISVAVRVSGPGPIFYRHAREGRNGRPFALLKFRTMDAGSVHAVEPLIADGYASDGRLFKLRVDPRVTGVGHFLRRFSLDELPQLVNVLRGDMSLVGPRPILIGENAHGLRAAHRVLAMRPGITGLSQVGGGRYLDWESQTKLEELYVSHWSVGFDVLILTKTIGAIIRGA